MLIYVVYDLNLRIVDFNHRKPLSFKICVMSQRRILYGRLESLERSRKGHLLSVTKASNALDKSLEDFGNVIKVRIQQTQVNNAFLSMLR